MQNRRRWFGSLALLRDRDMRLWYLYKALLWAAAGGLAFVEVWLVVAITENGLWTGAVVGAPTLGTLALLSWAGKWGERPGRRRRMLAGHTVSALAATTLFGLTATGVTDMGLLGATLVLAVSVTRGLAYAVASGSQTTFQALLAGVEKGQPGREHPARIKGAYALGSLVQQVTALLTLPAVGAAMESLGTVGTTVVVGILALSIWTALEALSLIDPRAEAQRTSPSPAPARSAGAGEGWLEEKLAIRYVIATPQLRAPLAALLLLGSLALNPEVLLPLSVSESWEGGPALLGLLMGALGIGRLLGVTYGVAHGERLELRHLVTGTVVAAVSSLVVAAALFVPGDCRVVAPGVSVAVPLLPALAILGLGVADGLLAPTIGAMVHAAASSERRSRISVLQNATGFGSKSVGVPLLGALVGLAGVPAGWAFAGLVALIAGAIALILARPLFPGRRRRAAGRPRGRP